MPSYIFKWAYNIKSMMNLECTSLGLSDTRHSLSGPVVDTYPIEQSIRETLDLQNKTRQ